MTHSPEETSGLERRAIATRTRAVGTIDALERRGARLVQSVNDARRLFALVADGAAVVGTVATLLALLRARARSPSVPAQSRGRLLGQVVALGMLAGIAYVASRTAPPARRRPSPPARLRAI